MLKILKTKNWKSKKKKTKSFEGIMDESVYRYSFQSKIMYVCVCLDLDTDANVILKETFCYTLFPIQNQ